MADKTSCVMFYRANLELKEKIKEKTAELNEKGVKITASKLQRKIIECALGDVDELISKVAP